MVDMEDMDMDVALGCGMIFSHFVYIMMLLATAGAPSRKC
jgi:hypothetical protein